MLRIALHALVAVKAYAANCRPLLAGAKEDAFHVSTAESEHFVLSATGEALKVAEAAGSGQV